jgi:fructose-specific phosphotransferase system IIC component
VLHVSPGAILSLIATLFTGVIFMMMVSETIALGKGQDPITNLLRSVVRAYPRFSYVVAVVLGMLLGHLFWP